MIETAQRSLFDLPASRPPTAGEIEAVGGALAVIEASRAHPFTKWAGGKADLLDQIRPHLPKLFGRYHERFLGGGALFYDLAPSDPPAVLNDDNAHLVNAYVCIRDDVERVIQHLTPLRYESETYYHIREQFNAGVGSPCQRAAWFLYLLRVCYNGLWRVNRAGQFNTPIGRYSNPTICDAENLRACSRGLRHAEITCGDFEPGCAMAHPGDLVYFDPPYVPMKPGASFTSYTAKGFTLKDHERLRDLARRLTTYGVLCVLSNSDTPIVRELYADEPFRILSLSRKGNMSSKGSGRQDVPEVLILNY